MNNPLLSCTLLAIALSACPPVAASGPADCGTTPQPIDAGPAADAGPDFEAQVRFVNLGRVPVTVTLEGEDAGQTVPPLSSLAKTGHVTLIKQRGTVAARNLLADGGTEPVLLPFDFDPSTGQPTTFVIQSGLARLSTNVTVGKQTQGATFGERVSAGLANVEIPGGVDTDGDCLVDQGGPPGGKARVGLRNEPLPEGSDCDDLEFVRPGSVDADATPYFVAGAEGGLQVAWVSKVSSGLHAAGGALASGASLLGGAMPGGAILSSAAPQLYVLNAHPSKQPATVDLNGVVLARDVPPGALVRVKASTIAAADRAVAGITGGAIAGIVVAAVRGTISLGQYSGPCKPPYLCDFLAGEDTLLVISEHLDSTASVLKTGHDTVKNSVGNVRCTVIFASTGTAEASACAALTPADDTCAVGAAVVSSVGSLAGNGGGAAAASYAATGRLLYPPTTAPQQGTGMRFVFDEGGQRFAWASPAGLTPVDHPSAGFAIVASGAVLDAADRRALFFVDFSATPWTVQSSLSK